MDAATAYRSGLTGAYEQRAAARTTSTGGVGGTTENGFATVRRGGIGHLRCTAQLSRLRKLFGKALRFQ